MTGSLFRRLFLIALAIIAVTLFLVDTEVRHYIRDREAAHATQRLSDDVRWLADRMDRVPDSERQKWTEEVASRIQAQVTLIDSSGAILADSAHDTSDNQARRPEFLEALQKKTGVDIDYAAQPVPLIHVAVSAQREDGTVLILRLTAPIEEPNAGELRLTIIAICLGAALLALGIAFFISRSLSRRVSRLQQIAAGILGGAQADRPASLAGDDLASLERSLAGVAGELRRLLDRLSFESARREAILSSMAEGVLSVDPDLRVTFCNEAFLKAVGFRGSSFEGLALLELVRDPELRELLLSVLQTGAPRKLRLKLSVETPRIFEVQASPLATATGRGAIAIFHDTTDLERLEQVRKDFVANVSHELRTPLAGIIGYAETLLDGGLDDNANKRRFVEIIRTNAIRLNSIAADLLVLSELEAGGDPPEPDIISIAAVLDTALIIVESEARLREVTLIREQVDDVYVSGSRLRLEQVVLNLLANGIKFNRPGGEVRVRAIETDDGRVAIAVSDTGVGIPSQDLPRIFERFYRVDKARSKQVGGTGLGLSIVKHAVERMGGTVAVESEFGRGSRFTLYLPSASPETATPARRD